MLSVATSLDQACLVGKGAGAAVHVVRLYPIPYLYLFGLVGNPRWVVPVSLLFSELWYPRLAGTPNLSTVAVVVVVPLVSI